MRLAMKKILILKLLTLLIAFVLFSCTQKKTGRWDDNIQLSTKTAEFNAIGDSIIITTKGSSWWIVEISLDDSTKLDFEGIDILSDQYKIVSNSYVVERRNSNTLFVSLEANPKKTLRILKISVEAGDYFDGVTITQKFQ
jgi:hypothetical protein